MGSVEHQKMRAVRERCGEKSASCALQCWWARQDLNLGPSNYEFAALTN